MSQGMPMRGMMLRQLSNLMNEDSGNGVQYFQMGTHETRYALLRSPISGSGYLYAVVSLVDVEEASRILLKQLWIITAALVVFSIIIAVILSSKFSHPIRQITQAAHEMSNGKLDIALPVRSRDEIGQLTEALNELGVELRKTEALRRELIANVSHELRSPLSVIQGFAETVRDVTWPNEEKRTSQLTMIADEASRLNKIVNDILDYSRLQAGVDQISVTDFSVCPVLKEMINRFELEADNKNLSIALNCPDVETRFDQNKFIQVLNNLIGNALNHANNGSTVYIDIEPQNASTKVSVKNSGDTIPPEQLKYVWDRYYRVDRISNNRPIGTGLGLSIVKSILDRHHVQYGAISENGETIFWFETLPIE
jgi:signal transduction histidine kinase